MLNRYKIEIEYDGTNLLGWQKQKNGLSVEQILEDAIFKFSHVRVEVYGAGRTDAGVHAFSQVAHFDLDTELPEDKIRIAMNALVKPNLISVLNVEIVNSDFHARFDAKTRFYIYKILNRKSEPVLDKNRVWWIFRPLDIEKMQKGGDYLIGRHDFTSFRSSACQAKSPIKTMSEIRIKKEGDMILTYLTAKSFLHHQVRNIMGTLKIVGEGKIAPEQVKEILDAKNRNKAGVTAPACGLYMLGAKY